MSDPDDDPACQFDDFDPFSNADLPDGTGSGAGGDVANKLQPQQKVTTFSPAAEPVVTDISSFPSERIVHQLTEVPDAFRSVFQEYPYFNLLQSKLLPVLLREENSVAVCAPTGSGKTALFELAIIRVLMLHAQYQPGEKFIDKIIYLSPLKSICSERRADWAGKFTPLGCKVCELTGDSDREDHQAAHNSNLIITTPEKWDAMTRKWKDSNRTIMTQTRLICIDEVHLLSEQMRGATLETIVSRVKTAKKLAADTPKPDRAAIRFVAVSATAPNISDIAQWLSVSGFPGKAYKMAQSDRPVKLTQLVRGIKFSSGSPYAFDQILSRPIAEVISTHGNGKPALIFCMTRGSASKSAKELCTFLPPEYDVRLVADRSRVTASLRDKDLCEVMAKGVAFHHAGLDWADRQLIEDAFRQGLVQALFSTSTLAMGVNLPAYMVILKGVHKVSGRSQTEEFSETELLQMTGRAGRPQFDDHGVAVIFCPEKDVLRYQRLMSGEKTLESFLHKNLPEHMNSEVVLRTIHNKDVAVDWLKSTFFYIRCMKNKKFYDISANSNQEQVDQHLSTLCNKELNGLNKYGMIRMSPDGSEIEATEIGRLMAHYCVSFETMKSFVTAKADSSLKDLLMLLCSSKEVRQETLLRQDEKKVLFSYSDPKDTRTPKIRFAMETKIKEVQHKVFTIWQIEFGLIEHEDHPIRFRNDIMKTMKMGKRLAKCLLDVLSLPEKTAVIGARTVRNATLLAQIMNNGLWEITSHVARQLRGIGAKYSSALVRAGLKSFDSIRSRFSHELDGMCNRKAPFGDEVLRKVRGLPIYQIGGRQVLEGPAQVRADFTVELLNRVMMQELFSSRDGPTAGRYHSFHLCIFDSQDKVIAYRKVKDESLLNGPLHQSVTFSQSEKEPKNKFTISLLSESYIGIDIPRRDFVLHFAFLEANTDYNLFPHVVDPALEPEAAPQMPLPDEAVVAALISAESAPSCSHKCQNKSLCLHDCCKTSAQVMRGMKRNNALQKSATTAKRIAKPAVSGRRMVRKGINVMEAAQDWLNEPDTAARQAAASIPISTPRPTALLPTHPAAPVLPDPMSALPVFPKPLSYSAARTADTAAQKPGRTPTARKRRQIFVEEDDDENDDEFEVVVSDQRAGLQPDRPVAAAAMLPATASTTAATCDLSPESFTYQKLIRFAASPTNKYRAVERESSLPQPAYAGRGQSPEQTPRQKLARFAASPVRQVRAPFQLTPRNSVLQREMDFRSNLTTLTGHVPVLTPRGAKDRGMDFRTNLTPVQAHRPMSSLTAGTEPAPATPILDRTSNDRGMDFRTFDQTGVWPQAATPLSQQQTGGATEYDELFEKMASDGNIHNEVIDLLLKEMMSEN